MKPTSLTPEQLKQNAAAMIAFAEEKPIEVFWGAKWEDYGYEPRDWHIHQYRPKATQPEPPKVQYWSKPDDVPGPVCWIRQKHSPALQMMIIAVWEFGIGFRDSVPRSLSIEFSQLGDYEHSTDRITWKPCTGPAKPEHKPHNPDHLTQEQVGEGWRLLDEDEVTGLLTLKACVDGWTHVGWQDGYFGSETTITYRTKLSREELRKARGL